MSIRAQNNVGGSIKRAIIVAEVAESGNFFNFFKQANINKMLSEIGKGRNDNKLLKIFFI